MNSDASSESVAEAAALKSMLRPPARRRTTVGKTDDEDDDDDDDDEGEDDEGLMTLDEEAEIDSAGFDEDDVMTEVKFPTTAFA
jgi:hypothetical protein